MIKLTQFTRNDIPRLVSWIPDAKFTLQWAGPKYSFEKLKENLIEGIIESEKPNPEIFLFNGHNSAQNEVVGHIQLLKIDYKKKEGRIGKVIICNEFRKSGFGKEMVKELCNFAFSSLFLSKLTLAVYDFNAAAIRTYEGIGFVKIEFKQNVHNLFGMTWNSYEMELRK
jgi:RimJ/RimL family protein N-acetyltransferase